MKQRAEVVLVHDSYGLRASDKRYISKADDFYPDSSAVDTEIWFSYMPVTCCYSSAWTFYLTFALLVYWAYERFGTGTGPYNVHLHSVWYDEPPVTWVVQVHTARGMSLVVEGDSTIDENREICMISTLCCKLSA